MQIGYRLAEKHGYLDVMGMLDSISVDQLNGWLAWDLLKRKAEEEAEQARLLADSTSDGITRAKTWG